MLLCLALALAMAFGIAAFTENAEGAARSVNLPEGLLACFGVCPAEGFFPVELSALDDRYMPVKEE